MQRGTNALNIADSQTIPGPDKARAQCNPDRLRIACQSKRCEVEVSCSGPDPCGHRPALPWMAGTDGFEWKERSIGLGSLPLAMSWQHQLKAVVPMSGIYRISPCRPRPGGSVNPRFIQLWVIPPKSDRLTVGRMSLLWI